MVSSLHADLSVGCQCWNLFAGAMVMSLSFINVCINRHHMVDLLVEQLIINPIQLPRNALLPLYQTASRETLFYMVQRNFVPGSEVLHSQWLSSWTVPWLFAINQWLGLLYDVFSIFMSKTLGLLYDVFSKFMSKTLCRMLKKVRIIASLVLDYSWQTARYHFLPIAIETLGPVGKEATLFVQELGRRISAITHAPRSLSSLWQRLSVAVQDNAACESGAAQCSEDDVLVLS